MRFFLVCLLLPGLLACSDDDNAADRLWHTDQLVPEIGINGGGLQDSPAPAGTVYYFNALHTAEESDVRMDPEVRFSQTVHRYLYVSGTAVPDDSGFTDRSYHSVTFGLYRSGNQVGAITLPVDSANRFSGYLYFTQTGTHDVYAFRAMNSTLYPRTTRGTQYTVAENYSTLCFQVAVTEAVPANLTNLVPTAQVNSGNQAIREQAARIIAAAGAVTDRQKAAAVYNFLIDGNPDGKFVYTYYPDIFPGYLTSHWNSIFIASHFLQRRKGVCNDFAELYAALVRSLGIPVKKVSGTDGSGSGHMWNTVFFEDRWWWLDATWANGAVAGGYSGGRHAYAAWSATPVQAVAFTNEHDGTYTNGFSVEY